MLPKGDSGKNHLALLRVCRQFYAEAHKYVLDESSILTLPTLKLNKMAELVSGIPAHLRKKVTCII